MVRCVSISRLACLAGFAFGGAALAAAELEADVKAATRPQTAAHNATLTIATAEPADVAGPIALLAARIAAARTHRRSLAENLRAKAERRVEEQRALARQLRDHLNQLRHYTLPPESRS